MARILLVEDAAETRESAARLLRNMKYDVACAADGREALAYLAQEPGVDLILLDLIMPVMDGFDFLERLRAEERWRGLPVIVFSATPDAGLLERARSLGATECLVKSRFSLPDLLYHLRRHIPAYRPAGATDAHNALQA